MGTRVTDRLAPADIRRRGWRAAADLRRIVGRSGSAAPALRSIGAPRRTDISTWIEVTARRHAEYRSAHPVADGSVAVVCVSMRPDRLDDVVRAFARQCGVVAELVFVANSPDFDIVRVESSMAEVERSTVVAAPPGASLGSALNLALETTDARFVAKFDDDDLYGPDYLTDALRAHAYAGAGVVGKHTYYTSMSDSGETHLRFPGHEFRYSGTLAGGTLVIDRERVGDQRFDDISLGEDRAFIARCHRRGISTFSADRFNFTQVRGAHNTWQMADDEFLSGAIAVDADETIDR